MNNMEVVVLQNPALDVNAAFNRIAEKLDSNQRANEITVVQLQEQVLALTQQLSIQTRQLSVQADLISSMQTELRRHTEASITMRQISDEEAKKEIISYIRSLQESGRKNVSDVDLIEHLNLPISQVDTILSELYEDGK